MGNELVITRNRLDKMEGEFANTLPAHISPKKFIRTAKTAMQMNFGIADACKTEVGQKSFFAACANAAKDGLILDNKEAALVTFNTKAGKQVQYIPMVAGLLKKARNSGQISSLVAEIVYENDHFIRRLGDDAAIIHEPPTFGQERGKPLGVYAIAKLKDGTIQREIMDKNDVMNIAAQSKNQNQYNPEEGKNWGEWWRKTIIRRIAKYLPSSSDRDDFMSAAERIDEDFDYQNDNASSAPQQAQPKQRGAGAAAFQSAPPEEKHDPETGEVIEAEFEEVPEGHPDPKADATPEAGDDI